MNTLELAMIRYHAMDNSFLLWIALFIIFYRIFFVTTDQTNGSV